MESLLATFVVIIFMLLASPLEAGLIVDPTLLSSDGPTLVTATTTGGSRFYTGTTPPPYRVRLTHEGVAINLLTPTSLTQTRLTFLFPQLAPGYYGYVIRAQDPGTGVWTDVYESSQRYFQVAADTDARLVFNTFDPTTPELQAHPWEFLTTTQMVVSGVITGSVAMAQHVTGGIDRQYVQDFRLDGEGDCGIIFTINFNLDGSTMFHYSIPFQMTIDVPKTVYAGQKFQFTARSFQFLGTDTLTVGHNIASSTDHRLWLNVPYDALSPFDLSLSQQPDKLIISAKLPLAPDIPPTEIGGDFNDGEASYGGVTLKLGGHADFNTSFDHIQSVPDGIRQIWTGETRTTGVWFAAGDQIVFLAAAPIPVVQEVAAALASANVELNHNWNLNVKSTDFIQMKPPFLFDFEVSVPPSASGNWPLHKNFSVPIPGYLFSDIVYEMATSIIFDMPFIDAYPIADWSLADIYFERDSQWHWFYADFNLDTQIEVLPKPDWMNIFAPGTVGDVHLANYTPNQASAESNRIASLVFTTPPEPPIISTTNQGTFPIKLAAEFALMLSTNPVTGGTITLDPLPVDGGYSNGTVVTVTANAASGFQFTGWSGDVTGSANPATIAMNDVKSIMANFTADSGGAPSQVVAWGNDDAGETVVPDGLTNVTAVAAGNGFSSVLKADGTVVSWGDWTYHQTNVLSGLSNVAAIASGWMHNLALKTDGTVVAWGAGTNNASYPNLGQAAVPAGLHNIVAVSGGSVHSMALDANGTVFAWGGRGFGETNIPAGLSNVAAIAAGAEFSLAVKRDGKVVAWGAYAYGATTPPPGLSNVVSLAAGWYHALALKQDGTVVAWGAGTGNTGTFPHLGQCMVPEGLSNVIAIAAGNTFSLALKRDGTLTSWGSYYHVPIGYVPMTVPSGVSNVTAIAAGGSHWMALVNGRGIQTLLSNPICTGGNFNVSLSAQRGKAYFLESKSSLFDASWTLQPPVYGDNRIRILSDPSATTSQRFYRVRRY